MRTGDDGAPFDSVKSGQITVSGADGLDGLYYLASGGASLSAASMRLETDVGTVRVVADESRLVVTTVDEEETDA